MPKREYCRYGVAKVWSKAMSGLIGGAKKRSWIAAASYQDTDIDVDNHRD